jgi:hypothetical protein
MNVLSPGQYPDLHFIKFIAGKIEDRSHIFNNFHKLTQPDIRRQNFKKS